MKCKTCFILNKKKNLFPFWLRMSNIYHQLNRKWHLPFQINSILVKNVFETNFIAMNKNATLKKNCKKNNEMYKYLFTRLAVLWNSVYIFLTVCTSKEILWVTTLFQHQVIIRCHSYGQSVRPCNKWKRCLRYTHKIEVYFYRQIFSFVSPICLGWQLYSVCLIHHVTFIPVQF